MEARMKMTSKQLLIGVLAATQLLLAPLDQAQAALTAISNTPIFVTSNVPPNMMLTLSVEWPTGTVAAYNDNASTETGYQCPGRDGGIGVCYFADRTYLGYFDPNKCYAYNSTNPTNQYFEPKVAANSDHSCTGKTGRWSGNFLNWSAMHALDEFRFAMSGGDRVVDSATETVIEKSFHNGEGGHNQFPIKRVRNTDYTGGTPTVPAVAPSSVTPEDSWNQLYIRVNNGNNPLSISGDTGSTGRVLQISNNSGFQNQTGATIPNGQYVRVELSGTNYLSLAEVQVLSATGTNYAQGQPATQSSTGWGGDPGRAVDGITDGNYNNNSVTHTNNDTNAYWQVDLGSSQVIDKIKVWGRTDCCSDRLANFYVFVSSASMAGRTYNELVNDAAVFKYYVSGQPANPLDTSVSGVTRDPIYVRTKVCDSTVGLESNCRQYGSAWKPTGLIQQNAEKMRFGVTAYLNDDDQSRPGGVLRSRMKFVGPNNMVPNGTPTTNSNPEISATDGTLATNPDPADATASGVSNSGVINYLNKFGKPSASYKSYDTLSEMFYEATRYMRNLSATPEYTSGTITDAMKDGFPYITNWNTLDQSDVNNRPIQYACQKTFFVGIADSNAWCDTLIPGNTATVSCGGRTATLTDSGGIQVSALDNEIGTAEGVANLGTWENAGRHNTFHLGGLAFWANTRDILPDDNTKPWTIGKQTAQSYWVDVRETGSSEYPWNQMWAAAKYGGFDDKRADTSSVRSLVTNPLQGSEWDKDSNTVPDNYFTGERPDKLINSLSSVFQDVLDRTYSGAGAAVSHKPLAISGNSYQVKYYSKDWTGDVLGNTLTFTVDDPLTAADEGGVPVETNVWSAQSKLQTLASGSGWDTSRKIATWNGTKGIPFRLNNSSAVGNLTAPQLTYLGTDTTDQQDLLNYVRGDRSKEGTKYRARGVLLGDIINSEATFVAEPDEAYNDAYNPGFSTFKSSNLNRRPMIYVGSNDGMLHAFNACTTSGTTACPAVGGDELWAYIPSFILSGPSSPATPTEDGLAARAKLSGFSHHYYVDQTPAVRSVDFARTGAAPSGGFSSSLASEWHTILVGGLNKGGKGFYAIDVTSPVPADEATAASKILWEFTDSDMGYSFGRPLIFKTRKYGWVVIVTSGYNNTTGTNAGQGYLYVLDAKTGQLLEKIGTGVGNSTTPSGFTYSAEFNPDFSNLTIDQVYGGDLLGNLWRFDLTQAAGTVTAYPAPEKIALLKDATNNAQPVTTEPSIEKDPNSINRWVFIGTGKLFDTTDLKTSQTQTFYALRDGTVTAPYVSATLPNALSFPVDRTSMVALTDPLVGITPDSTKPMGWYYDLTHTSGSPDNAAERIINTPIPNVGEIGLIGQTPSTDPCAPGVSSYGYVVEYGTGKTRLTDESGTPLAYYSVSGGAALKIIFVKDASGKVRAIFSTSEGNLKKLPGQFGFAGGAPVRLKWREVLQ